MLPLIQDEQMIEPALEEKVPSEQLVHPPEPALEEKVPLGQIVQPHKLVEETPTLGFALYLYPAGQTVH